MRDDYKKVVDEVCRGSDRFTVGLYEACSEVAKRCEALANNPVRELTDGEIEQIRKFSSAPKPHSDVFARAIIAAHIAKQSEPEEIPFSQEKLDEGGWDVRITYSEDNFIANLKTVSKVTLVRKP